MATGIKNGKKATERVWIRKITTFARASRFFLHFLAVVARLQRENAYNFNYVLSWTGTQDSQQLSYSFPEL